MILLIDNYDSFVFNLERYFQRLGHATRVIRNDAPELDSLDAIAPQAIVHSPGPCSPREAGKSLDLVRRFATQYPMLGVCLGHQVIAAAFGGRIGRAIEPMHGRTSDIVHDGKLDFGELPHPLTVCRYHSLIVEREGFPDVLEITATTDDSQIMGIRHRILPIVGWQFHPESILTDHGFALIRNFLTLANLSAPETLPSETPSSPHSNKDVDVAAHPDASPPHRPLPL